MGSRKLGWSATALACALLPGVAGCSDDDDASVIESLFVVPSSLGELSQERFFDQPWPSDLRTVDGYPVFEGYPNPRQVKLIADYIVVSDQRLEGFSPVGPGYLRFTGALDPSSLPATPLAATAPGSSVQLVDVEPTSPEFGTRRLVSLSFWEPPGVFLQANTLRFMPTIGFPLRHLSRYALVVTRDVRGAGGESVEPSDQLRQVLGLEAADGPVAAAATELSDAVASLAELGLPADRIAHLAVFRTGDPTAELRQVREHLRSDVEPPDFVDTAWQAVDESDDDYDEYLGMYGPSPSYQEGELPFTDFGSGGGFHLVDGVPTVVESFDYRFSLTVPKASSCPMPAAGYPIVLYAHGTFGDYRYHLSFAGTLAERCLASMGVDQIFHGERPGAPSNSSSVALLFFNFENPEAGRTNVQQSALDEVQRARLFTETGATVPAAVSATGAEIRFDGSKVLFMGHSQGGLNGPLYLALDESARGAVLSGSGSMFGIMMTQKVKPEPAIPPLVTRILLGLSLEEEAEYDIYHPVIGLTQWLIDAGDAVNYARLTIQEPIDGNPPKSIYLSEGIGPDGVGDSYAPPKGIEAQGIAMGLPLQLPEVYPIEELAWGGPEPVSVPAGGLQGNLASGQATGILAQWAPPMASDGHFVIFDVPRARTQAADFLRNLADDPVGTIPPP
ncbi:MAG: hypothetical protein JRI23_22505 [Deltaproteobacteria bacterium]|jgi:hypothetical protein|nr:hypothetical protein [Deltaproteobacteria bacterium]MBW2534726.1 hypothetical protein [Deltaproteobacteria bacterium]